MKIFLSGLLLALAIGSPVGQAWALDWPEKDELGSRRLSVAMPAWRRVEHLFTVERLPQADFVRYASALAQNDCALAQEVLWNAFTSLEPELKRRATRAAVAHQWADFVLQLQFPEFAFCTSRENYESVTGWLDREGVNLEPQTAVLGWKSDAREKPFYRRILTSSIQVMFGTAHEDNPDAIRFVLEQDRVGRFVKLTDEQRLSLIVRLVRLGEAGPDERARAMELAFDLPLGTVAAARRYAAREVEPEFERWQAYQARLRELTANAPPPGSP